MERKIRVAIAGGTGYTGGELFRILMNHPNVEIVAATTTSSEGTPVASVHRDLIGETDLCFGTELNDPDVIFLCLGHGISRQFVDSHDIKPSCHIIDLGNDFRLEGDYAGRNFVYGLCESAKDDIRKAHDIANPGCFATAIQLALLPLAKNLMLNSDIHVTAITGSTGAGVKPSTTSHFSWRNDNVSIYKPFKHQHLAEIKQSLKTLQNSFNADINFIPVRGCFSRGIMAIVYMDCPIELDEIKKLYEEYYEDHNFTFVTDKAPDLKDVVNTNKCILHLEKVDGKWIYKGQ